MCVGVWGGGGGGGGEEIYIRAKVAYICHMPVGNEVRGLETLLAM